MMIFPTQNTLYQKQLTLIYEKKYYIQVPRNNYFFCIQ